MMNFNKRVLSPGEIIFILLYLLVNYFNRFQILYWFYSTAYFPVSFKLFALLITSNTGVEIQYTCGLWFCIKVTALNTKNVLPASLIYVLKEIKKHWHCLFFKSLLKSPEKPSGTNSSIVFVYERECRFFLNCLNLLQ